MQGQRVVGLDKATLGYSASRIRLGFAAGSCGASLLELLLAVSMIAVMAALVQPTLARAYLRARTIIAKARVFHEMRLDAFGNETVDEADLVWMATHTPKSFAPDHYIWQPQQRRN
jgi:hypothetical protein